MLLYILLIYAADRSRRHFYVLKTPVLFFNAFYHSHKIFAAACFLIVRQILSDPQIFIVAQIFIIVTQIPAIIRTKKIF